MANPFDQFSTDLSASLPPQPYGAPPPPAAPYGAPTYPSSDPYGMAPAPTNDPFAYSAPPAPAPVAEPPAMTQDPWDAPTNEPKAAYGQAPPNPYASYAPPPAEPSYAPQQYPPEPPNLASYGAPPPPPESNPYGGAPFGGGAPPPAYGAAPESYPYGAPPAPEANPYGAPQESTPYGAPAPNPYGAPPEANPYGAPPDANPYGAPQQQYGAPPPQEANPYGAPQAYGAEPNPYGAPPQPNPYGAEPNPYGAPPQPNPYGAPAEPNPYGAPPPADPNMYATAPNYAAYGAPPPPQAYGGAPEAYGAPPADAMLALVPSQQPSNPYAQPGMGGYGQPPPPQAPYGYAPQPPPPPPIDPFSVFESQKPPVPAPLAIEAKVTSSNVVDPTTATDDEFWGSFGPPPTPGAPPEEPVPQAPAPERRVEETKDGDLPPGGEWYDARIFTPTLGVMFFKPQELTDSLFLNTDPAIVKGLGDRPVVAFIVEGSSARSASVELGHVLLKVNGVDVKNPKEASRLIKEGPRPLPLVFYIPKTDIVVAEGEHMVKYDTKDTMAPNSAKDWKPKYVVIGGIIAQPWMMNMYRSKSEYDIAVIETQARRPVSVKVKQFSLQGARIQNDWQGPQMVKYKNKLHPWKFICVLPVSGNPIKISSPNLTQLKPVHEGIRRVLLAQQRGSGGGGRSVSQRSQDGGYARPASSSERYDAPTRAPHDGYVPQHERQGYVPQQQQAYGY
jgi:hypothetical protein